MNVCRSFQRESNSCQFSYQTRPPVFERPLPSEFSLFSFNNGMVVSSCRELDNNRSALSAASAFAIATAGANEGTPTKEKYRRMSLASTGQSPRRTPAMVRSSLGSVPVAHGGLSLTTPGCRFPH